MKTVTDYTGRVITVPSPKARRVTKVDYKGNEIDAVATKPGVAEIEQMYAYYEEVCYIERENDYIASHDIV